MGFSVTADDDVNVGASADLSAWEAIWAELHMAPRERMGHEASPSAAVLDDQSVESATIQWVTPARR